MVLVNLVKKGMCRKGIGEFIDLVENLRISFVKGFVRVGM